MLRDFFDNGESIMKRTVLNNNKENRTLKLVEELVTLSKYFWEKKKRNIEQDSVSKRATDCVIKHISLKIYLIRNSRLPGGMVSEYD